MSPDLLTLKQTAERLSCSYTFAKSLVDRNKLRHIRDGRFVRVYSDAIAEYLNRQTVSVVLPRIPDRRSPVAGIHFR